jgi:TPP-dependent 2-oxoacid decarboxylase
LPEDGQTSKHGGGGRYNAILEFKWEQIQNFDEKEKENNKKEKEKKRNKEKICMRKRKEKNMSMYDIKSELPGSLKCISNFKVSRLKDPNSSFQTCAIQ